MHHVLLHLSLIEGIGPATALRLMRKLGIAGLSLVYILNVSELRELTGLTAERTGVLQRGLADKRLLDKELALIAHYEISVVTLADEAYPFLLKNTHLPPMVLYSKGSASLSCNTAIAMVGSRKADAYGQTAVNTLIPALVQNGWFIVSGGALGLDSMAHQATIANGGVTLAVLGSGLLKPYPKKHKPLFKKIIEQGGALVSPFPLQMEAMPGLFPARNRVIAGLSRGCVVVQAGIPSGALITAQYALDEGREVFAVPGAFDNSLSVGCHKLISEGALLTTCADDILKAFN